MRDGELAVISLMHLWLVAVADNGLLEIKADAEVGSCVSNNV